MTGDFAFDVLRGMDIEAAPYRLYRRDPAPPADGAPPAPSPQDDALQRGYEAGWQQGHADGLRSGQEEGRREAWEACRAEAEPALQEAVTGATAALRETEKRLAALLAAIEGEERARRRAAEDEMVALCYETVCAILGARSLRPATVRAHLAHVAARAGEGGGFVLHVHPEDAELMRSLGGAATGSTKAAPLWIADPDVSLGGCRVVQAGGGLDLRLETALARCKELLLEVRGRRRGRAQEAP